MPMSPWSFLSNCVSEACGNCSIRSTGIFSLLSISGSFVLDENQWNASKFTIFSMILYGIYKNLKWFKISCAPQAPACLCLIKKVLSKYVAFSLYLWLLWMALFSYKLAHCLCIYMLFVKLKPCIQNVHIPLVILMTSHTSTSNWWRRVYNARMHFKFPLQNMDVVPTSKSIDNGKGAKVCHSNTYVYLSWNR